ncbi:MULTISPECIES: hypothetical protein [Methanosarcina]|nr:MULTISPECIES: hypothetical protein [Methanosarcina]
MFVPFGLHKTITPGFSPIIQIFTALETIAANLFWIPPLVG